MKPRRLHVVPTPVVPAPDPRQRLRDFAAWLYAQDPVALARLATDVPGTLASVAGIEVWFRRYAVELTKRRVQ